MAQWDWFALWERRLRSARMARDDVQRRLAAVGEGALALSLPEETAAGNGAARPAAVVSRAGGAALRSAGIAALLSAGADRAAGLRSPVSALAAEVQAAGTPAARAANLAVEGAQAAAPAARRAFVLPGTAAALAAGGAVAAVADAAAGVLSGPPDWLAEAEASPLTGLIVPQHQVSVSRPFSAVGGTAAPLAAAVLRSAGTEAAASAVLSAAAAQPAALQQTARPELLARGYSDAFVQREAGAERMASFAGGVWPGGVFDFAQAGAARQTAAAQRTAALFAIPEPSGEESLRRVPRPAETVSSQAERIVVSAGGETVRGEERRETGDFWELWTRRFAEGLYSSPEGVHG